MSVQNLVLNKVQTKFLIIKSKIFSVSKILDRSIWMNTIIYLMKLTNDSIS
jgi:hypothetical protein